VNSPQQLQLAQLQRIGVRPWRSSGCVTSSSTSAKGDCSAVTGGTKVLSDRVVIRITQNPGESFIDRMIALVEGAQRQKTPNEIALPICSRA